MSRSIAVVTGAAGFMGSHLVDRLLAEGWQVRGIDRPGARVDHLDLANTDPNFSYVETDLATSMPSAAFFDDMTWAFHCAGVSAHSHTAATYLDANLRSFYPVAEGARRTDARVIYVSSAAVYGLAESRISESVPLAPHNSYAFSKYLLERTAEHWHQVYGLPLIGFRIFHAYGPRLNPYGVVGAFAQRIAAGETVHINGDGGQLRDFVYVADVVEGFVRAAQSKIPYGIYNLGTGIPNTILDLATLMSAKVEFGPPRANEPRVQFGDISRLRQDFGWAPQISLTDGLGRMHAARR